MPRHHLNSYSAADGAQFALRLADALTVAAARAGASTAARAAATGE